MKPSIVRRPARWKLAAVAYGLALLAAACGSSGTPSGGTSSGVPSSSASAAPATTPPNAVLCGDAAALRASLDKLTQVKVGTGTASQIRADLDDVEANLTALVNHGQWQAQTSALQSSLTTLKTAVSNLASNPSASTVSGVVTALGGVNTAARNLLAVVNTSCPSASPSPST